MNIMIRSVKFLNYVSHCQKKIKRTVRKRSAKENFSVSYNKFKEFEGKQYTGMKVGRKWSTSAKTQRTRLIKFLQEFIAQLQKEPVPLQLEYDGKVYKGEGIPIPETCQDGVCPELDITLNDQHLGILHNMKSGWKMDEIKDQNLVDAIGQEVLLWYE